MKHIILHIWDRVHHKTLGGGVVIAVNEDLCTVRFSEKEAYFRIPEAFVRGYLTSEDARFGSDKTYKQITEITASPQKNKLGWIGWLLAIGVPAPYTLPFVIVFLIISIVQTLCAANKCCCNGECKEVEAKEEETEEEAPAAEEAAEEKEAE